jgi:hypothetical protein
MRGRRSKGKEKLGITGTRIYLVSISVTILMFWFQQFNKFRISSKKRKFKLAHSTFLMERIKANFSLIFAGQKTMMVM